MSVCNGGQKRSLGSRLSASQSGDVRSPFAYRFPLDTAASEYRILKKRIHHHLQIGQHARKYRANRIQNTTMSSTAGYHLAGQKKKTQNG